MISVVQFRAEADEVLVVRSFRSGREPSTGTVAFEHVDHLPGRQCRLSRREAMIRPEASARVHVHRGVASLDGLMAVHALRGRQPFHLCSLEPVSRASGASCGCSRCGSLLVGRWSRDRPCSQRLVYGTAGALRMDSSHRLSVRVVVEPRRFGRDGQGPFRFGAGSSYRDSLRHHRMTLRSRHRCSKDKPFQSVA